MTFNLWHRCDTCDVAWINDETCWCCGRPGHSTEKLWLTSQIGPGAPFGTDD